MRVLIVALAFVLVSEPALAYVDPNTGGLLYQLLMPVVAMISIGYALLKKRIQATLKSVFGSKTPTDSASSSVPPP